MQVFILAAVLAGCAGKPQQIVWTDRVGKTTYQQVVTELGPPDRTIPIAGGGFIAEWVTRRAVRPAFGSSFSSITGPGGGPSPGQFGPRERVLRLSFDQDGKLTEGRETFR